MVCALVGLKRWDMMKDEIRLGSNASDAAMSLFRLVLTVACPILVIVVLVSGLM